MGSSDYYELLGVPRSADEKEIRKAYRNLARKYHPDVCKEPGAEERFKEINEAYAVLSDSQKRSQYDHLGHETFTSASKGSYSGAGGFGGGGFQADFSGFGDIFDFFGSGFGGARGGGPRPGSDLLMRVAITLEDAVKGVDREITVDHYEACTACNGTGSETKKQVKCTACGGSGQVHQMNQTIFGQFVRMGTCSRCQGIGKVPEKPCNTCRGSGRTKVSRKIQVHIPAGIDTGMRMRMEGYGEAGDVGAPNGDLYIEISVKPHERFTRTGDSLETMVTISPAQAALGTEIEIETIDHRQVTLTIPPGVQYNTSLRIAGEGIRRRGRPGDLLVRIRIATPRLLSSEERELYEKILALEAEKNPGGKKGIFGFRSRKKKG